MEIAITTITILVASFLVGQLIRLNSSWDSAKKSLIRVNIIYVE